MKRFLSASIIAALALLASVLTDPAAAQTCSGQFAAGRLCGNSGASTGLPGPQTLTSMFDRALCGTNNATAVRIAGTWQCLSSANSGVWVTSGAGLPSISSTLPNGLALGTPASGTMTNVTGLPVSTGISGLGTGVAAWLATPSSSNFAAAMTNETGSGNVVFSISPALTTPSFSSIVNTGTLTLPTSTDTLLGRATSDTLSNKAIDGGANTITGITSAAITDGTIATGDIGNDQVTYAKLQNVSATDRVLCRDTAGAGDVEECALDASLAFTGGPGIGRAALTGDVTAAAGSNATTIANDAVTFGKLQNIATDTLIGRDTASTGDPEAISVGGGLEFTGAGGIQRSALTGDVTASAGSGATTIAANAVALGTDTTGNYMSDIAAGTGIAVTHTQGEGSTGTVAFDYSAAGTDPALAAGACRFDGASGSKLVCEGATVDTAESRVIFTDPTGDRAMTIPDADSNPVRPLTCGGTDKVAGIAADGTITCAPDAGGAGSGDNISVNGTAAVDADFDDATPAAVSGGVNVKWQKDSSTPNNLSAFVPADGVANTVLANMAQGTIKGRASGAGTGDPTDLSSAQATAILDSVVGDSGSGGTKGLVPAPAAGDAAANKFLKANGTWQPVVSTAVQVVNTMNGAVATGSTLIPADDTIPQSTEGDQYMSLTITPKSSSNVLRIDVTFNGSLSVLTGNNHLAVALFQDSAANALAATSTRPANAAVYQTFNFTHYMTAGTTSATTFKVRAGPSSAATLTFNGESGARLLGGVSASSITITEYVP